MLRQVRKAPVGLRSIKPLFKHYINCDNIIMETEEFLPIGKVAKLLGVTPQTLYAKCDKRYPGGLRFSFACAL